MTDNILHIGTTAIATPAKEVAGDYVTLGSEKFYRIANVDGMDPFFMSIVSASDHWLFLWSSGGLTAGRQNADNALFPYYTEDKLRDQADHTGPRTVLRVTRGDKRFLWEPFSRHCGSLYDVSRNLYKNVTGNIIVFEEINRDLALTFRYSWKLSDRFGFVKHSELVNSGQEQAVVEVLDGLENLMPQGLAESFQTSFSSLGDAYKQSELDPETGLATYALSSLPGDSPEPSEALRASVCWSTASRDATRLLSSLQLEDFRRGGDVSQETRICGRRGSFFVQETRELAPGERQDWLIVADVDYGLCEVAALQQTFGETDDLAALVLADVGEGTRRLNAIVARADGLQTSGDRLGAAHHFANVLFNVMRGGIFESAYAIDAADLRAYVRAFNRATAERCADFLNGLSASVDRGELLQAAEALDDPDLLRLLCEYLPISFSRRHGDPSRPWNKFSINVKNRDGSKILDYQGNWRDIFQNWEALCLSFPEYFESIITKFVNTSTADGYNPYRVMKSGYDWEVPDPDEPWAHFGYWGDHQLIYLLKLLEWSRKHHPGELEQMLRHRRFVYADVPYDIKPYADLLADPRDSLVYNTERAQRIAGRVSAVGADGRYLPDAADGICGANLAEKLLVPLLAKIANFVAGGGFWMNTQRPEWNDANNALAGFGISVVTLCYARRYVSFCLELFEQSDLGELELNEEVASWLRSTAAALAEHQHIADQEAVSDAERKALLDALGAAAEDYRRELYAAGLSGRSADVPSGELLDFLRLAQRHFDHTIRLNRRGDGLYHAYNVLHISAAGMGVEHLTAMLEGQVSVLSSGALGADDAMAVVKALRASDLYRADQHSYLLYPDRVLPGFLDKNTIPAEQAERSELLASLVAAGNTELVERDITGALHFNSRFSNIRDVRATLDQLAHSKFAELAAKEAELICEIFEALFQHQRFTGRSGTFYGYEGLGCIYWHQVSKLLLAVQESSLAAADEGGEAFASLADAYYDVRAGIGFNKSPNVYGAFPTDPYSHTPGFAGARQPGMTGQVKEEIITRLGELGVVPGNGQLAFRPALLRRGEFLEAPEDFAYYDVNGTAQTLALDAGTLAFTYCQVPVVYRRADAPSITVHAADGSASTLDGLELDGATSSEIFRRSGAVARLEVTLSPGLE